MNISSRPRKWRALGLLIAVVSAAACSSGGSLPTGTGGRGGAAGSGAGGNAGTTGTAGTTGAGGSSGPFVNAGQCGERGSAMVNATTYDGYAEFFVVGEAGLGSDVCTVRFTAKRVPNASPPAGCPSCNWAHLVELTNPTVMVNEGGACDANDGVPAIDAAGRFAGDSGDGIQLTGNRSGRGFSLTSGHGDALLKYSDAMKMWIGVGRANWDEGASSLSYNISNGNCMYGR